MNRAYRDSGTAYRDSARDPYRDSRVPYRDAEAVVLSGFWKRINENPDTEPRESRQHPDFSSLFRELKGLLSGFRNHCVTLSKFPYEQLGPAGLSAGLTQQANREHFSKK